MNGLVVYVTLGWLLFVGLSIGLVAFVISRGFKDRASLPAPMTEEELYKNVPRTKV